jgi:hypothetical protein
MTPSADKNTSELSSSAAQPISVHRAFVYSASAPGLGEFYAGSRIRGLVTAALFLFFTVWLVRMLFVILSAMVSQVFGSFTGTAPFVMPNVPFFSMGVYFFGLYFIWLWAMISAVDVATEQRQQNGGPPQASVAWAAAISWFCPGAGQVYRLPALWLSAICRLPVGTFGNGAGLHPAVPQHLRSGKQRAADAQ